MHTSAYSDIFTLLTPYFTVQNSRSILRSLYFKHQTSPSIHNSVPKLHISNYLSTICVAVIFVKHEIRSRKYKRGRLLFVVVVVLGLTALSDSFSVYIGQSPKEREKEKRKDR